MFSFLMPRPRRAQSASVVLTLATRHDLEQLETRTLLSTNIISFPSGSPAAGIEGAAANAGGVITFELLRYTDDPNQPLTVNLAAHGTGDHPATPGEDFVLPPTATFPAGDLSAYASVDLTVTDDNDPEPQETFALTIEPGSGYDVDDSAATTGQPGMILESDVPYVWAESSAATGDWATAEERGSNATLYIKRDNTKGSLPVRFRLMGNWGPEGYAATDDDYSVPGATPDENGDYEVSFADGEDTIPVEIAAADDPTLEHVEGFQLYIDDPAAGSGAVAGEDKYYTGGYPDGQSPFAVGRITDNDTASVSIEAVDDVAKEDDGGPDHASFIVRRTQNTTDPMNVFFNFSQGTGPNDAVEWQDYQSATGDSVFFAEGQDTAIIDIIPIDDSTPELNEDLTVTLIDDPDAQARGYANYTLAADQPGGGGGGQKEQKATILDDDVRMQLAGDQENVTGATVASILPDGMRHFVTTKDGEGLVILVSTLDQALKGDFSGSYRWDGINDVDLGADSDGVRRMSPGRNEVHLVRLKDEKVLDKMVVWVVWADLNSGGPTKRIVNVMDPANPTWWRGQEIHFDMGSTATISPAEIFDTTQDIPDLRGAAGGGLDLQGGVQGRWDMSRRVMVRTTSNPPFVPLNPIDVDQDFPTENYIGNDDAGTEDEAWPPVGGAQPAPNDPYAAAHRGQLYMADDVVRKGPGRGDWFEGFSERGDTFVVKLWFQDFVRLQLGSTWFVISDPLAWHVEFKMKKIGLKETDWSFNSDGSQNGIDNRIMMEDDFNFNGNGDFNGDGAVTHNEVGNWRDDPGSPSFGILG